jgi:predicted nucleotide-binding protein (sugar kinase/HSP70/actin superfamily)
MKKPRKRLKEFHIEGLIQKGPDFKDHIGCYPSLGVMNQLVDGVTDAIGTGDRTVHPPPNSKKTLDYGTLYSPEGACLPLKLITGSLLECQKKGANTVGMITEKGPCRLGFYSLSIQLIFSDLDLNMGWFDFNNISIKKGYIQKMREVYKQTYGRNVPYFRIVKSFIIGFNRLHATERLEAERNRLLAYEIELGSLNDCFVKGRNMISKANHPPTIWLAYRRAKIAMRSVPLDMSRQTVKILINGEVFCALDQFTNANIESRLARHGAEPFRVVWQTDYILWGMGLDIFSKTGKRAAIKASRKYMKEYIGGDCSTNVGYALMAQKNGLDGMIHIKPFGCMVEFVAQNVLNAIERDTGFPVLSLTLDEVSAGERFEVRIEAFVDNVFRKKYGSSSRRI